MLDSDAYFNFIPAKLYGLRKWGDLFTNRQLVTICAAARFVNSYPDSEVKELLALALDRCIDCWVSFARWKADAECPVKCLARQAIPMVWDFAEANPLSRSTRSLIGQVGRIADAIRSTMFNAETGIVEIADAKSIPLPDECASIWFTDPPYYDAIPYSYLSGFFYVWLKRCLPSHPLFRAAQDAAGLTTKSDEIIDNLELLRGIPKLNAAKLGIHASYLRTRLLKDGKHYYRL